MKQQQYRTRFLQTLLGLCCLALGSVLLSGCVYKIDIQQGNIVTQAMLDKLEEGMPKSKVRFVMGTPLLKDVFNADRWDYYYSHKEGSRRFISESFISNPVRQRRISLFFDGERLVKITGDVEVDLKAGNEDAAPESSSAPLL